MTVAIVPLEPPAPAAAPAAASARLLERIAGRGWRCLGTSRETGHARDHLRIGVQRLAVQQFGERAVGNAKPDIHRLELFVGERPDATAGFHRGQRRKERVNRVRTLRATRRGRRRGCFASSSAAASTAATAATTTKSTATTTTTTTRFAAATAPAALTTGLPVSDAGTLLRRAGGRTVP
jgi:hypothetical protein